MIAYFSVLLLSQKTRKKNKHFKMAAVLNLTNNQQIFNNSDSKNITSLILCNFASSILSTSNKTNQTGTSYYANFSTTNCTPQNALIRPKMMGASLPFDKNLLRVFLVVIYSFIFMIGVPGNILVILTIIRVPKMRSIKNLLIANIAFGDLISILWCLTTALLGLFVSWPYGELVCKYLNPMSDVIIGNTVFTIVVISFERYRAIISPFSSKPTLRRTVLAITFFWVLAYVLIGVPLVKSTHLGVRGFWVQEVCSLTWPSRSFELTYRMVIFVCVFLVPCIIVLFCFVRIKKKLEENIRFASTSLRGRSTLKRAKRNQRLIKMLLVIFVCFTACFLPVNTLLLAFTFAKEKMLPWKYLIVIFQLAIAVLFLNSVMNPIILYMLSRDFRNGYIQQIKCVCPSDARLQRAMNGLRRISTYSFRLSGLRSSKKAEPEFSSSSSSGEDDGRQGGENSSAADERITEHELLPCLQGSDWSNNTNNSVLTGCTSVSTRNSALFLMEKIEINNRNSNSPKKVTWSKHADSLE